MAPPLRLHYRLVLPFVLVAVIGATVAAYAALSVTTDALASHVKGQLLSAAAQISRREFALSPAILRTVRGLTGAEVLTYQADGTVLASTLEEGPGRAALLASVAIPDATVEALRTSGDVVRELPEQRAFVVYRRVSGPPDTVVAVIGRMTMVDTATAAVSRTILLSAAASLLLLILVSQFVARRLTAPIDRLVTFTRGAALGGGSHRAEAGRDEVGRLAEAFNDMLDRLNRSRQALVRSEKLALAGLLAARVAHDIRNPLSSVKMQTQLLLAKVGAASDDRSILTSVLSSIEQVEAVVRDLLQLARPSELKPTLTVLNDVVSSALQQIAPQCAHRKIAIQTSLAASLPPVDLDADRFRLALLNVLANAAEAMTRGGIITVATRMDAETSSVILEVCDDGAGIDTSVAGRLFDPFVSTKPDGVGLGLVNAKAVVESHGGTIVIENREPSGACVTIRLRRSRAVPRLACPMADILVVDDDLSIATAFERFLSYEGHEYRIASNADDALAEIQTRRPDLVIMDVRMPGIDGLQALETIRQRFPGLDVVIMTAYGSSQTSIDAIRAGAFDYLTKPLDLNQLRIMMQKVIAARTIRAEASDAGAATTLPAVSLVGDAPAMLDVYKMIGRLATNDVPALIIGEWGTGKRLVAQTIHENSGRRSQTFLPIDCAAQSEQAIGEELFAPGAGTIQLDNVEALPAALQGRLVRALGARGARSSADHLSARLLASTASNLEEAVAAGAFNRELHDFLGVITLRLPPLRDRREDIPSLVRHFVHRVNAELGRDITGVDAEAMKQLSEHSWPGNVRELEGVIKRASMVARSGVITSDDIGEHLRHTRTRTRTEADSSIGQAVRDALHERLADRGNDRAGSVYHDIVDIAERALVQEALTITGGNQVKASELLGVNRATLRKKSAGDD